MELVSFKLCPFVQRTNIVIKELGQECEIKYIDPSDPPSWFFQASPQGKVPILKVDDQVVFESAIICEYLDDISEKSLLPTDPLEKALTRGWVEYSSTCLQSLFAIATTPDMDRLNQEIEVMKDHMILMDTVVSSGPFFNGENFSMVDAAFAPLFIRLELLQEWANIQTMLGVPKVSSWCSQLLKHPSVQESTIEGFSTMYRKMLESRGGALASAL